MDRQVCLLTPGIPDVLSFLLLRSFRHQCSPLLRPTGELLDDVEGLY